MATLIYSRIAPTPSGYLHMGNAYNFLLTSALTRQYGGSLRLRIDDLDAPRVRPEYVADIFETLQGLGIVPDAGPLDAADHALHFAQQLRVPGYETMLQQLTASGKVFACTCSRATISRANADDQYPGTCREKHLPLTTPGAAWRMRTDANECAYWQDGILGEQSISLYQHVRDFIIRRRDGLPAYHVASLCDDVVYGSSLIVRGEDLLYSTAAQLHLAEVLGLTSFSACRFYHHPLLRDTAGEKLSKSAGSYSLKAVRERGMTASCIRHEASAWYRNLTGL